jgi:hypothetical protein
VPNGFIEEKGIPAVLGLPTADTVLNGAQDEPLFAHMSIGWTTMKQGTSPGDKGSEGRHWASAVPHAKQVAADNRNDHIIPRVCDFEPLMVSLPLQHSKNHGFRLIQV